VETDSSELESPQAHEPVHEDEYLVGCLLGRWGKNLFYLRWLDGTYGWEPRKNILDCDLLRRFEDRYAGFRDGLQVLGTRKRNGKVE
jgi:hypothetical protein